MHTPSCGGSLDKKCGALINTVSQNEELSGDRYSEIKHDIAKDFNQRIPDDMQSGTKAAVIHNVLNDVHTKILELDQLKDITGLVFNRLVSEDLPTNLGDIENCGPVTNPMKSKNAGDR